MLSWARFNGAEPRAGGAEHGALGAFGAVDGAGAFGAFGAFGARPIARKRMVRNRSGETVQVMLRSFPLGKPLVEAFERILGRVFKDKEVRGPSTEVREKKKGNHR